MPFPRFLCSHTISKALFCFVLIFGYFFIFGEVMNGVLFWDYEVGFVVVLILELMLSCPAALLDVCDASVEFFLGLLLSSPEVHI